MKKINSTLIARHEMPGEFNSGEDCRVCTIGYIPISKQVNMMVNAGLQLNQQRGSFDFENGEDDNRAFDPTLNDDYDMSDASMMMDELSESLAMREVKDSSKDAKEEVNEE